MRTVLLTLVMLVMAMMIGISWISAQENKNLNDTKLENAELQQQIDLLKEKLAAQEQKLQQMQYYLNIPDPIPEQAVRPIPGNQKGHWQQIIAAAPWSKRYGLTVVTFQDKIWVMGGHDGGYKNDIWSSPDGEFWTCTLAAAPWKTRYYHSSVVFHGKIWVMGGSDGGERNDVWCSANGKDWTQMRDPGWKARHGHISFVYDNKIWIFGGQNVSTYLNDVWYSQDGETWTCATPSATWVARTWYCNYSGVVYDNKMWLFGGHNGTNLNDIWYSKDGQNWSSPMLAAPWSLRYSAHVVVWDNKIWLMGGNDGKYCNDVWSTHNGRTWTQNNSPADPSIRGHAGITIYQNKIWLLGGCTPGGSLSDVWVYEPEKIVSETRSNP